MITDLFHRKRLLFWLIKAYIKKRKRTIGIFFLAGIFVAAIGYIVTPFIQPVLATKTQRVGIVGAYTIENLPIDIQNNISLGLTHITQGGEASPSAATSVTVSNDGKKYDVVLRNDLFWQDGKKLTAQDVNYNFQDVVITVKDEDELSFQLKDPYAPFPNALKQPLFKKGLIGLTGNGNLQGFGDYKVGDIDFNKKNTKVIDQMIIVGNTLETDNKKIIYKFYPNEDTATTAFMLGEVDTLMNLVNPKPFESWKNVSTTSQTMEDRIITLFYNTSDPLLSDKSVRQALNFALPNEFTQGIAAVSPISRNSWSYAPHKKYVQNIDTAKKLLGESEEASKSATRALTLTTTSEFEQLANSIKQQWETIGVVITIDLVDDIEPNAQISLRQMKIPDDPDQYIYWHSTQTTNVSHYASPKIDKLLEDGRQITNREERLQIYTDFQRYLTDDAPAAFLYYPIIYTVVRN